MIFGAVTTLPEIASTMTDLPPETPPKEKYLLLIPILLQLIFAGGLSFIIYRKVIRALFITEKLTLHPSYFAYSHGIWGNFKQILQVKKEDLVSFAVSGNSFPVLKFLSKSTDGSNHLYVHYNKRKKKEIMGGRSDDEYVQMIDILEPYRTSEDIYNMAVAVKERETLKEKDPRPSRQKSKNKKGIINNIKALFGPEPLDEKDCLKTNGILGLLMLPGIIFFFLDKADFPFPPEFLAVQITIGIVLAGGYLSARINSSLTKKILVFQGTLICVLVFIYTFFMWHVSQMISSGKMKTGMGHAPGILAYGAAYGIKQVICFSGLSSGAGFVIQKLPLIFFIIGACCDILVMFFIFQCFGS
jgi:hypothetical protein